MPDEIIRADLSRRFMAQPSSPVVSSSEGPGSTHLRPLPFSDVAERAAARQREDAEYWPNRAEQLRRQRDEALEQAAYFIDERNQAWQERDEWRQNSEHWKRVFDRSERMRPILWAMGALLVLSAVGNLVQAVILWQ